MHTKKISILLVEDEPVLRSIYSLLLKKEGFEVRMAEDGKVALKLLLDHSFDLVLLDLMLPVLDGMGVLTKYFAHLKKHHRKVSPKIILLTNLGQEEVLNKALALGSDGYLLKSDYNPAEFVAKVHFLLKNS